MTLTLVWVASGCRLVLPIPTPASWKPSLEPQYSYAVQTDVVYAQGAVDGGSATADLKLDLYLPEVPDAANHPLVVLIHGGGFTGGDKSGPALSASEYARRGYIAASINYRLQGDDPVPSARVQPFYDYVLGLGGDPQQIAAVAAIDDTLAALDFLTARSDVNAANVVLWGSSAGAITALYAEYSTDDFGVSGHDVAAVIDNWGGFAGGAGDEDAIDPGEASLHIVHGTNDTVVPYALTEAIIARAAEIGHPVEVYPIEGAGHGVNLHTVEAEPGVTLYQASVDWLDSVLGTNALTN